MSDLSRPDRFSVIAGRLTWIEGSSIDQLRSTMSSPDMREAVAFPDVQPWKGSPSGAAFVSDLIRPALVGTDIGCGVALWETDFPTRRAKPDRLSPKLDGLDQPWEGDPKAFLIERGVDPTAFDHSLGTPGHSNHFTELQQIVKLVDADAAAALNLDPMTLKIVVHSGSRGFGEAIFLEHAAKYGADGLAPDGTDGMAYRAAHNHAMAWAGVNRTLCATRVLDALNVSGNRLLDVSHNSVTPFLHEGCACWLHRKGAAPADCGPVLIPGSRDDLTFLVQPINPLRALASIAHGAGRKIARKEARGKLERLYPLRDDLKRNRWGGQVICGDKPLLWEEAKECYKDVQTVIDDLEAAGLIRVIATLRPVVTFKSSELMPETRRQDRETWQRQRAKDRAAKR